MPRELDNVDNGASDTSEYVSSIITAQSPYQITSGNQTILIDASSGILNVKLPNAITNTGTRIKLVRTDNTPTIGVEVYSNPLGQITYHGANYIRLWTLNETYELISNGAVWTVVSHLTETQWVTTATLTIGGTTTPPTMATTHIKYSSWRRQGKTMHIIQGYEHSASAGTATGTGDYIFYPPLSAGASGPYTTTAIDPYTTAEAGGQWTNLGAVVGNCTVSDLQPAGNASVGACVEYDTNGGVRMFCYGSPGAGVVGAGFWIITTSAMQYKLNYSVEISQWDP